MLQNLHGPRTTQLLTKATVAAIIYSFSIWHVAWGQSEQTLTSVRTLSLAELAANDWHSGLRPVRMLASAKRVYLLMVPVGSATEYSSLLVFSEEGSFISAQHLSQNIQRTIGMDRDGNILLFRRDNMTTGEIETRTDDGALRRSSAIVGSPGTLRKAELELKIFRSPSSPTDSSPRGAAKVLSQQFLSNHNHFVTVSLEDDNNVKVNLTRPEVIVSDPSGAILLDHVLGRAVLDRYSSRTESHDPNVSYPELYQSVITPRGNLFALVSGTKLENGGAAVQIDTETGTIASVLRFILPTSDAAKNADNAAGYLVPGAIAICNDYVFLMDGGTGVIALYRGQF